METETKTKVRSRPDEQPHGCAPVYFVALTTEEAAAAALGISEPTAKGHWIYARAWHYREFRSQCRP